MNEKVDFLLLGNGRVSKHLQFYLQQLHIPYLVWQRADTQQDLINKLTHTERVLFLTSDDSISSLYDSISKHIKQHKLIHFSGSFQHPKITSCHPLMSFGENIYPLQTYKEICFVIAGKQNLNELLPGLDNNFRNIELEKQALYHALCVYSGNFPQMLWKSMEKSLMDLGFEKKDLKLYLTQCLNNFLEQEDYLTGPLVRNDEQSIQTNKKALKDYQLESTYEAFEKLYQQIGARNEKHP